MVKDFISNLVKYIYITYFFIYDNLRYNYYNTKLRLVIELHYNTKKILLKTNQFFSKIISMLKSLLDRYPRFVTWSY